MKITYYGKHSNVHIFKLNNGEEIILIKSTILKVNDNFIVIEMNENHVISINKNNIVYHEQISLEQYALRELNKLEKGD